MIIGETSNATPRSRGVSPELEEMVTPAKFLSSFLNSQQFRKLPSLELEQKGLKKTLFREIRDGRMAGGESGIPLSAVAGDR